MNQREIEYRIIEHISREMSCSIEDISSGKQIFIRMGGNTRRYVKILSVGETDIIAVSPDMVYIGTKTLQGKSRDELYESGLTYGQTIHYIPEIKRMSPMPYREGFEYSLIEGGGIDALRGLEGFGNALGFDEAGRTPTKIALLAKREGTIAALAGATFVNDDLMEVGVDVKREYRRQGLATLLVRNLSAEIINRGKIPFYSASVTNLASQAVAVRSGYMPYWTDTYGTR